ncbi:MAG: hypothetical protein KDC80_03220 [Saprospiraceae bacterium]|nr:hypothetical protein [Saprospiraceae bacterium]
MSAHQTFIPALSALFFSLIFIQSDFAQSQPGGGNWTTAYPNGVMYAGWINDQTGGESRIIHPYGVVKDKDGQLHDCGTAPDDCISILKDADNDANKPPSSGPGGDTNSPISPPLPDDAPDDNNPGGGQQPTSESLDQNSTGFKMIVKWVKEYNAIKNKKRGVYVKKRGQWTRLENWSQHQKEILKLINKRR